MLQSARLTKPRKVYKTKSFDRWAKKILPDVLLCSAAREIERLQLLAESGSLKEICNDEDSE